MYVFNLGCHCLFRHNLKSELVDTKALIKFQQIYKSDLGALAGN